MKLACVEFENMKGQVAIEYMLGLKIPKSYKKQLLEKQNREE